MPSCTVLQCKHVSNRYNVSNGGISYHRFPHNPHIREKWIEATGRQNWMPTKGSTICSKHFDPKYIVLRKSKHRYLALDAVPTLDIIKFYEKDEVKVKLPPPRQRKQSSDSESENSSTTSDNVDTTVIKSDPFENTDSSEINLTDRPNLTNQEEKLIKMLRGREDLIRKQRLQIRRLQAKLRRLRKKFAIADEELQQRKIEDDQNGIIREEYVDEEPEYLEVKVEPTEEIEFVMV